MDLVFFRLKTLNSRDAQDINYHLYNYHRSLIKVAQ